jgi:NAD(P)-dependent dehydrogenase (short-subunit alcohol dehydrogenase family)
MKNSESETEYLLSTNLLGPLRMARAVLPEMRRRGRGVIVNVCGVATYRGSPNAGLYCASKAALSSLTESLQAETEPLGVRVCLAQLGHFRTSFLHTSSSNNNTSGAHRQRIAKPIKDYDPVLAPLRKAFNSLNNAQPGDPIRAAKAIVQLAGVRDDEGNALIPQFLPLGSDVIPAMVSAHEGRLKDADVWGDITRSVDMAQA